MKLNITKQDRQALKKVFKNFGRKKTDEEVFYDLCFCLLTPQTTFKANRKVMDYLMYEEPFYECAIPKEVLEQILKPVRFYRNKTRYLIEAKKKFPEILYILQNNYYNSTYRNNYIKRDWLVKNIKGLGMKTASHFLRNLGEENLAVIDIHICKFLADRICSHSHNKKKEVKFLVKQAGTKKGYLWMEEEFCRIAKENKLSPAILDAYLWKTYSGTPWEEFKF